MNKFDSPWEHYIVDDFFPETVYNQLKNVVVESDNTKSNGTRTYVKNRYFFTPEKTDSTTLELVKFFQDNVATFQEQFGYDLSDSYIRMELAQDTQDFWQEIHLDTLDKRITIIVFLERDDEIVNLATDLFSDSDGSNAKRAEWKENRALVFKPQHYTWHGFTERKFAGHRRVLLINFVSKENWESKNQVWDL